MKKVLIALAMLLSMGAPSYAQTAGQAVLGFLLAQGSTYNGYTCPAAATSPCFVQYGSSLPTSGGGGGSSNATIVGPLGSQTSPNGVSVTIASDQAAVAIKGVSVTTTDKAGTLTSGGAAQTAIASNASRKGWCIQNPVSATEDLFVRVNGTASASTGVDLSPGFQACNLSNLIDTTAVSVFAATTSHTWLGFEVQ